MHVNTHFTAQKKGGIYKTRLPTMMSSSISPRAPSKPNKHAQRQNKTKPHKLDFGPQEPGAPSKPNKHAQRQNKTKPHKLDFGPQEPGAPSKPNKHAQRQNKTKPKKIRFRGFAFARQPSLQDEEGNSVPGTEKHTTQPHSSCARTQFFAGNMVQLPQRRQSIPYSLVRKRLLACTDVDTPLRTIVDEMIDYLTTKKHVLLTSTPGTKVLVGAHSLTSQHIYIIDAIIEAIHAFMKRRRKTNIRRAAIASARNRSAEQHARSIQF